MPADTAAKIRRRVAANLRAEMAARGLTVPALARRAELDPGHLSLVLDAGRIELETLVRLAGALEVPPERLLEGIAWVPDGRGGGELRAGPTG